MILQRERDERKLESLEERAEHRGYLVRFIDTERRLPDQLLSLVVGTAIVLAYAGLLANKWAGVGWVTARMSRPSWVVFALPPVSGGSGTVEGLNFRLR